MLRMRAGDDESVPAYLVTLATAGLLLFTRVHPLVLMGAGALVGALGLL